MSELVAAVDITLFVLDRLWELKKDMPEDEFKGRAEELLYLYRETKRKFDPEFTEQMQGFKWCGYDQEDMRGMRDHAIASGWRPKARQSGRE